MRKYKRTNPKLDPVAIGRRVRELRKKCGWRMQDLADRSGVHPAVIGLIEVGIRRPSLDAAVALAVVFRRSIEHILFGLPNRTGLWKL